VHDVPALNAAERVLWESLDAHPTEHRVHLETLGVDVRVQELGSGPPALFIHGGSTWGSSWADLAVLLQSFRCLLLDRPGTGYSDPLPRGPATVLDLTHLADVLVRDVLDAFHLDKAHLVATSFGGWFALRAALEEPERVDRMAILGWTAGAPVGSLPLSLRIGTFPIVGELVGLLPVGPRAVRQIFRSIGEDAALRAGQITPEAIEAYAMLLRHTDTLRNERDMGRLFLSGRGGAKSLLVLTETDRQRIVAPVTFVWGDGDPFGGPAIAEAFASPFPRARLELIPGVGHAPWLGETERVADFVSEALTG
jgi:pimeloyl-ACP methyl ester carboxylesterase